MSATRDLLRAWAERFSQLSHQQARKPSYFHTNSLSHWIRVAPEGCNTPLCFQPCSCTQRKHSGRETQVLLQLFPGDLGDLQHGQRGYGWDNSSICQKWKEGIEAKWSIPLILLLQATGQDVFTGPAFSSPWWRWLRIHTTWLILAHDVSCPGSLSGCRLDFRASSKQDRHAKLHNLMPCPQYVLLGICPVASCPFGLD